MLTVFYGIYFGKMLAQKRRCIQTRQIGRRKEKEIHTVETLMSVATLGVPMSKKQIRTYNLFGKYISRFFMGQIAKKLGCREKLDARPFTE